MLEILNYKTDLELQGKIFEEEDITIKIRQKNRLCEVCGHCGRGSKWATSVHQNLLLPITSVIHIRF